MVLVVLVAAGAWGRLPGWSTSGCTLRCFSQLAKKRSVTGSLAPKRAHTVRARGRPAPTCRRVASLPARVRSPPCNARAPFGQGRSGRRAAGRGKGVLRHGWWTLLRESVTTSACLMPARALVEEDHVRRLGEASLDITRRQYADTTRSWRDRHASSPSRRRLGPRPAVPSRAGCVTRPIVTVVRGSAPYRVVWSRAGSAADHCRCLLPAWRRLRAPTTAPWPRP